MGSDDEIDDDCLALAKLYLKGTPQEKDGEKTADLALEIEASIVEWMTENVD